MPAAQELNELEFMRAIHTCFGGKKEELNYVTFKAEMDGVEVVRTTTILRDGDVKRKSNPTPIRRA